MLKREEKFLCCFSLLGIALCIASPSFADTVHIDSKTEKTFQLESGDSLLISKTGSIFTNKTSGVVALGSANISNSGEINTTQTQPQKFPLFSQELKTFSTPSTYAAIVLQADANKSETLTTIDNIGKIIASTEGISVDAKVQATITNKASGSILAQNHAIQLESGSILNQGTITRAEHNQARQKTSPQDNATILFKGTNPDNVNRVTNSGSIENKTPGSPSIVFVEGQNHLTLETGSQITGDIRAEGTNENTTNILTLEGYGSLRPMVFGFQTLNVKANTGAWTINEVALASTGDATITTGNLEVGETLSGKSLVIQKQGILSGEGNVVFDTLNNRGRISAGHFDSRPDRVRVGTLTLTAPYTGEEGSTYTVKITGPSEEGGSDQANDLLILARGGDFSKTSVDIIFVNKKSAHVYEPTNTYTIVKPQQGSNASFKGFSGLIPHAYAFLATPTLDEQGRLTIALKNPSSPFMIEGLGRNARAVASALSQAYEKARNTPDASTSDILFLNQLLSSSNEDVKTALNSQNTEVYGATITAARSSTTQFLNNLYTQVLYSDVCQVGHVCAWSSLSYGYHDFKSQASEDFHGFQLTTASPTLGFYTKINPQTVVGGVVGYEYGRLEGKNISQSANTHSINMTLYGKFRFSKQFYLKTVVGYVYQKALVSRSLLTPVKETLKGSPNLHTIFASTQGDWYFHLPHAPYLSLAPFARIDFLEIIQSGAKESVGGGQTSIASKNTPLFSTLLGGALDYWTHLPAPLRATLRVGWRYNNNANEISVSTKGSSGIFNGTPVNVYATGGADHLVQLEAGAHLYLKHQSSITLAYTALFASTQENQAVSLSFQMEW